MTTAAERINEADDELARKLLSRCCAAAAWVEGMMARRPFDNETAIAAAADQVFWSLGREDFLEAFAAHPQIGDIETLRAKYADSRNWSEAEQSGVDSAGEETLRRLATANAAYLDRFGYIFIVCATGKTAAEMLAILEDRFANRPDQELSIAAAEQLKITQLRLEKLAE